MERGKIMSFTFDVDEIFEMAEGIERNGAKFYRQAAQNCSDKKTQRMLLDMAAMENEHLATFTQMREKFNEQENGTVVFDPDDISALYLQTMADAHGWEGRITPIKELTGDETVKDILEIALNAEKESVVFYFGLKGLVPSDTAKKKVEEIIIEEISHITTLLNKLKSLG